MSRIGNQPLNIPAGVTVNLDGRQVSVTGPKGNLNLTIHPKIQVEKTDQQLVVKRAQDDKLTKSLHGLTRSLLNNLLLGVTQGFQKTLDLVGTGYRVKKDGDQLNLSLGFSHPVVIKPIAGIKFDVKENNQIIISGINKQLVGQVAADIRALKKPEPYKGKGIRYQGEIVRRKPGKAAKTEAAA